ncbi:precorrin-6y C5,15-methyltransferase (decarboxylating) subunit CbiE [Aeromicrobium tamlense]|uniref:Precorrin-6Y C5,15-methyltransferase (Decarboxylating) n=1 Tax=Aeromicrobium tamlense TaxID=375541 RepID=A0A8I0FX05_9ACTN|nr:precorrin-6y C5,15-methyltransferase (decarboxylating) subunit CbiE [Aeromicrobium tamlense]MBD1270565.1 precorrin-6y C5,15-methyltransferase (decarboxylating) subunit CbiE [Aeromicrobium tamlense]MBD1271303.1 precorrin-6y C5,15-methyltransferase (decarboxylating) subunit CbiE [Aeromicrobium tamlense]NYI37952.1 precorrin-6Y C5,15-methyltransferase (decarboxylating) [Aeromicrobium tamlense]
MSVHVTVVGVGADGWAGLPASSRAIVEGARTLLGGDRHLAGVPAIPGQIRRPWPSPLRDGLPDLVAAAEGPVVALASGDPLVSGIGTTLIDLLGTERVVIVPAVSSVALARARMGWPAESVGVVSVVGRDVRLVVPALSAHGRLLVLSSDESTPAAVATLLTDLGWGASRLVVLGDLGGADETRIEGTADAWHATAPRLNVLAVEVRGAGPGWAVGGVLPDDAFDHAGQITKRDVRASALARLAPAPGQLLWDVGAGSGSIGVEWMRAWPSARAIAIESRPDRATRVRRNADAHGVPGLEVVEGDAPAALSGLERPDAVFVGGGATVDGVLDACWTALLPGGRLVVHAVTAETEAVLLDRYRRHGGDLVRLHVERAEPLGTFTGWTPARAVSQWSIVKGDS